IALLQPPLRIGLADHQLLVKHLLVGGVRGMKEEEEFCTGCKYRIGQLELELKSDHRRICLPGFKEDSCANECSLLRHAGRLANGPCAEHSMRRRQAPPVSANTTSCYQFAMPAQSRNSCPTGAHG